MTIIEVKNALIKTLKTAFDETQYKFYSSAVTEKYERPCFFTTLKPVSSGADNFNSYRNNYVFYINYLQKTLDEADNLKVIQKIKELFMLNFKVGDRTVDVIEFNYDFVGTERNIPEISIEIEWHDAINHKTDAEPVKNVQTKITNQGE